MHDEQDATVQHIQHLHDEMRTVIFRQDWKEFKQQAELLLLLAQRARQHQKVCIDLGIEP